MNKQLIVLLSTVSLFTAGCATPPHAKPVSLRLLSYNIHHGEGLDRKLNLPRIATVISNQSPDWVSLQEVENGTKRTKQIDQTAELARLTGLDGAFAKSFDFGGGGFGNATLSRHPRRTTSTTPLPASGEPRCFTESLIQIPGLAKPVLFIATHLDWQHANGRLKQMKAIVDHVAQLSPGAPVILAGDFNAESSEATLAMLLATPGWMEATAGVGKTCPADLPKMKIDHIFVRPGKYQCKVIEATVMNETVASDHRPVFCQIELIP